MHSILTPVLVLVVLSLLVWIWMYATRIPAMQRAAIVPQEAKFPGSLDRLPDSARQVADNYNHLMEQPTIFYAIALTLALMDFGGGINAWLAWGYVGFRIVHSLLQCTINVVRYRLVLFTLASLCLLGLTVHAAVRILHDCGIIG